MRLLFRTYPTHHQKIMVTTTNFIFPETLEISSSAIQKMVVGVHVLVTEILQRKRARSFFERLYFRMYVVNEKLNIRFV